MDIQTTMPATNMVLEKLKKHLRLFNFRERPQTLLEPSNTQHHLEQKTFSTATHDTNNSATASLTIAPTTTFLNAWFIKILDMFFSESLLLDTYTLKLNFLGCSKDQKNYHKKKDSKLHYTDFLCPSCQQEWHTLLNTLQVLSISFAIDHSLHNSNNNAAKVQFEFSLKHLQTIILAYGSQVNIDQTNEYGAEAHINITALLQTTPSQMRPSTPVLHLVVPLQPEQYNLALLIAITLHQAGKCVDLFFNSNQQATNYPAPAKYLVLLGAAEQKSGTAIIQNLTNNVKSTVKQTEILDHIK